jgi:hemerythrin-like metal-binding protein
VTLLEWRPQYSVGVEEVDHEHRLMIGLINSLHERLGQERSGERVEEFFAEIHADIAAHFALEEKVMRDRHYDALAAHKADHERLLDELREMMDEMAAGAVLIDERLGARLSAWFGGHFQTHDARLHKYLQA